MFLSNLEKCVFFLITVQHFLFASLGTVTNIIMYKVFKKKLIVGRLSLLSLNLLDLFGCAVFVPVNYLYQMNILFMSSDFLCKIHSFLIIGTMTLSSELLVVLAIEHFLNTRKTKTLTLISISIVTSFILSMFGFFSVSIEHQSNF